MPQSNSRLIVIAGYSKLGAASLILRFCTAVHAQHTLYAVREIGQCSKRRHKSSPVTVKMSIARLLSVAAQAARGGNSCISAARSGTPLLSKLTARTYNWNKPSFLFPLAFGLFSTASPSSSSGDGREVHVDKAADLHQVR